MSKRLSKEQREKISKGVSKNWELRKARENDNSYFEGWRNFAPQNRSISTSRPEFYYPNGYQKNIKTGLVRPLPNWIKRNTLEKEQIVMYNNDCKFIKRYR